MIIDVKHLTPAELTEVTQDLTKILTKKKKTGAAYLFWHNLLGGIIRETDTRILKDIEGEPGQIVSG